MHRFHCFVVMLHRLNATGFSKMIAKHVMNIHMNRPDANNNDVVGEIDLDKMKAYIAYCKR